MDELTFWQIAGNQIAKRLPFIERMLEPLMIRSDSKAQAEAIRRERQVETDADVEHTLKMAAASYAGGLVENGTWTPQQAQGFINYGAIVGKAAPLAAPDVNTTKLDDDWIAYFRQRASTFSNEDMQEAFARLLAGEANNPGSYSRVTIDTLAKLEPHHAQLLRVLRSFSAVRLIQRQGIWVPNSRAPYLTVVIDLNEQLYRDSGLGYEAMVELECLGIISMHQTGFGFAPDDLPFMLRFPEISIALPPPDPDQSQIKVGVTLLTFIGQQLLSLCDEIIVPDFVEYIAQQWRESGYQFSFVEHDDYLVDSSFDVSIFDSWLPNSV